MSEFADRFDKCESGPEFATVMQDLFTHLEKQRDEEEKG